MSPPTFRLALLVLCLAPGTVRASALAAPSSFAPMPGLHFDVYEPLEFATASAVDDVQVWFNDEPPASAAGDGDYPELRVLDYPEERVRKAAWVSVEGEGIGVMEGDASLASLTEAWILLAAPLLMPALLRLRLGPRRRRLVRKTWADQASEELEAVKAAD